MARQIVCMKLHKRYDPKDCNHCEIYLRWFRAGREGEFACAYMKTLKGQG